MFARIVKSINAQTQFKMALGEQRGRLPYESMRVSTLTREDKTDNEID